MASQLNNLIARTSKIEYAGESKSRHLFICLSKKSALKGQSCSIESLNMKVAAYYGPYMQREGFCGEDDPFDPHYLEDLITALGGTPVAYEARCQSVGSPSLLTNEKTALRMTHRSL